MKWTEFSIHTTQDAVEPISNILHDFGASGVVIEDPLDLEKDWDVSLGEIYDLNPDDYPKEGVIVKAYLPSTNDLSAKLAEIIEKILQLESYQINLGYKEIKITEVDEENWATAWKKYYKPVKITDQLTVVPTWEDYDAGESEIVIELDPGMAFGTGTHPTTILCMKAIEKYIESNNVVIDVGTGSGVLSITAAKTGASRIYAYDLDEVAVRSANENININGVANKVEVKQNNLLEGIEIKADMIVGNLLAEIVLLLIQDAYQSLHQKGYFISSGIIKEKENKVSEQLVEAGFTIIETMEMEDWVAIVAKK